MSNRRHVVKPAAVAPAGALALLLLLSVGVAPAHAAAYAVTVHTDQASYTGAQQIKITGTVSPAPGPNTGVIVSIESPTGSLADINEVVPDPNTGNFSDVSVPGGSAAWVSGTYTVNATWGGNGASASGVVTFSYSPAGATSTTTTASPSTTTSSTSTVPEFPASVLAPLALIGMAAVALLTRRMAPRPPSSGGT